MTGVLVFFISICLQEIFGFFNWLYNFLRLLAIFTRNWLKLGSYFKKFFNRKNQIEAQPTSENNEIDNEIDKILSEKHL